MQTIIYILPELFISSAIMLFLMLGVFIKNSYKLISFLTILILAFAAILTMNHSIEITKVFNESYIIDKFSSIMKIITFIFKEPFLKINTQFLLAMSHQVFLVSLGAFSILMYLIKKNSASKTVSLFFLIPVVTALMAWLFLGEILMKIDIIGFIVASLGVFLSTRK